MLPPRLPCRRRKRERNMPTFDLKATKLLCISMKALCDEIALVVGDYPDEADLADLQEALQDSSDVLGKLVADAPKPTQQPADDGCGPGAAN